MMSSPPTSFSAATAANGNIGNIASSLMHFPSQHQTSLQQPSQHQQQQQQQQYGSLSPEQTGQRLLSVLNDVLPLVDQDPEMLSLMQDVTRLVCDYE